MDQRQLYSYLSMFLGPKAENASMLEESLLTALRDYTHWRKNYFPDDPILVSGATKKAFDRNYDNFDTRLGELLAALRRNFPFYSPRYVAHELSDTLIPATLGYFIGTLFNPNNVTPEAAPVTTELEVEVCAEILRMLGYTPPPLPPSDEQDPIAYYQQKSREQFGWAHLTSGGTIANIEALWVARQTRYFPLAVKAAATAHGISLTVKRPNGDAVDIRQVDDIDLLLLKPNESIYLLSRFADEARRKLDWSADDGLFDKVWSLLDETGMSIRCGVGPLFSNYPPVVLVAGTRHYSVAKAVDVLGIGQASLISIDVDSRFRMRTDHLEQVFKREVRKGRIPMCVVASAGSTEEGAVDPLHEITDLRKKLERQNNQSFWLHVDAAWGGFIRSLFAFERRDELEIAATSISTVLTLSPPNIAGPSADGMLEWHDRFADRMKSVAKSSTLLSNRDRAPEPERSDAPDGEQSSESQFPSSIAKTLARLREQLVAQNYDKYISMVATLPDRFQDRLTEVELGDFRSNLNGTMNWLRSFVSAPMAEPSSIVVNWPDREVGSAFLSFPKADSITTDPHKMGYAPYPAGCVCFKNDRIRSFVLQKAPYITAAGHNVSTHVPPRHMTIGDDGKRRIVTSSFSPFMLEGSKPGAVAAGLWLATKVCSLHPREHGLIVRASLLSARMLHEWLSRWLGFQESKGKEVGFELVPLTPGQPDTNLVVFVVKPRYSKNLARVNALTEKVYERFSIQAELGEREHSYSQPFFLSNTRFRPAEYPADCLKDFFERSDLNRSAATDYLEQGLVVLRATVMNPYLLPALELSGHDYCKLFLEEIHKAAQPHSAA